MKQAQQARNTIQEMENLIVKMNIQLINYRYIIERLIMKHGCELNGEFLEVEDSIDYSVMGNGNQVFCNKCDTTQLGGIDGNYLQIVNRINELNK